KSRRDGPCRRHSFRRVRRQGAWPNGQAHRPRRPGEQRRNDGGYRRAGEGDLTMFDLSGLTALVTGASGGIGSAIARGLAAQGARLAVSGSNVDKLEAFRADLGGDHVALACDLSDAAAVDALV